MWQPISSNAGAIRTKIFRYKSPNWPYINQNSNSQSDLLNAAKARRVKCRSDINCIPYGNYKCDKSWFHSRGKCKFVCTSNTQCVRRKWTKCDKGWFFSSTGTCEYF